MNSDIFKRVFSLRITKYILGLLAFILIVLLFDKVIMPWYVRLGEEYELPDVVSMRFEEAKDSLEHAGFRVMISDSVYDQNYPPGTVIEQMPPAYSKVKEGRHVYLRVSIGEKPIIMPNLFFKSPREAELILKSNGLELGAMYYEYSDLALENVVIGQSYPQGQLVKRGTKIDLTISLGPFPKQKVVPGLVGKSLDVAKRQLQLLGVKTIRIEYEYRDNILPETVISQSVKAGTPIENVKEIKLVVSQLPIKEE
ncbi:MAG: PASTA domain-containing protein [Calditrichaeota bacterium]|nr:PASTA domain-containing protein [Calditrichota bacterium]